jgi:outer membrane receptor protein involved in Fe transport
MLERTVATPHHRRHARAARHAGIGGRWTTVLSFLLLMLVCRDARAQTTGGIRGFVKDDTGSVLVGVTVEATSPARIGGAAIEITDAQGLYNIENLPPGEYTLVYSLQGFGMIRRENLRVEVGRTIQADVQLKIGNVEQSITVSGESPVVDAVHAGLTTNFNNELLQNIPTIRLGYFDVITYAPSVKLNQVSNCVKFIVFGSSSDQNSYQYDGIEINAPSNGGVWDYPSPDMIQEVQVKAIGASAEYFNFQGGVINIVTKSGSNQFRGTGSMFTVPSRLVANNTPNEQFPYRLKFDQQVTWEMGGPIRKDRLWLYGMIPWSRAQDSFPGVDPSLTGSPGKGWKPFLKATWRASSRDNVDGMFSSDNWRFPANASRESPIFTQTVEHMKTPKFIGHWTRTLGGATLFELKGGAIFIRDYIVPFSDDFTTPRRTDLATGLVTGNAATGSNNDQTRATLDASLAHHASGFISGSHDFKFGVQFMNGRARSNTLTINGATYTDFNGEPYQATFRSPAVTGARFPSVGTYINDNWSVNDRITLNLGVRFDHVTGEIPPMSSQVTLVGLTSGVTALSSPTNVEYPGIENVLRFDNFSPRLGLTYRLDASGKTILKTHYGRYYGKVTAGMFNNLSPGSTPTDTRRWNPVTRAYDIPVTFVDSRSNYAVDPDLRSQYTEQVFVGIERQVMADMGVDVTFVYKKPHDFVRLQDVRGTYAPRNIVDVFRDQSYPLTVWNLTSPSSQQLFMVTNRDDIHQEFKSVVFQTYKRFSSSWQAQGSYTWQDSKGFATGSVTGNGNEDFQSLSPTGAAFRTPNEMINAYGPMPTNNTHSIKVSSTYQAPFDFHFGMKYSYESSRPIGRLITVRGLSQGTVTVLAEPRGSYTMPATKDLQVRIDRDFRLTASQKIRLSMDIANILNTGTVLSVRNNSSQTGNANFGQTLSVVRPRAVLFGVRYQF